MVQTYTGKSPRNARIKIDYTGECPSVQFKYPRKDGFEGSMRGPLTAACAIIVTIAFLSFGLGNSYEQTMLQNETQINNTNVSVNSCEVKNPEETIPSTKEFLRIIGVVALFYFLIIVPPIIINKLFRKKLNALFPIYQAWKTKKK